MFTPEQINVIVAREIARLLDHQLEESSNLTVGWESFFATRLRRERHALNADPLNLVPEVEEDRVILQRARQLVGAVLACTLRDLGQDIAFLIELEFPTEAGRRIADELRTTDPLAASID